MSRTKFFITEFKDKYYKLKFSIGMQKYSSTILRIGLGLVMLWFGSKQLGNPIQWISFLPDFTKNLPISQIALVSLNGWFEVIFGLLLIVGFYTRLVAGFLTIHLLGIVVSVGYTPIGVRDFGLMIGLFSIFLGGVSPFSVDLFLDERIATKVNGLER